MIAGMAVAGFDDTPRDEDPMPAPGRSIIGHVISTGQTVIAPDVRIDPHYVQGRVGTLSEIAVPIVSGGSVIGALNLESSALDAFSEADVEFLEFFAVAAAISIERAVLHREMLEKNRIEQQLSIAKEVQMPSSRRPTPCWKATTLRHQRTHLGNRRRYFDYLPQPDGRLGVALPMCPGRACRRR